MMHLVCTRYNTFVSRDVIFFFFKFILRRIGENGKSDSYKTTALHDGSTL